MIWMRMNLEHNWWSIGLRLWAFKIKFKKFVDMAKYILTNLSDAKYRLLKRIVEILWMLLFCIADCERALLVLWIALKIFDASLYATYEETVNLDIAELSQKVAMSVWQKEGKKSYYENDFMVRTETFIFSQTSL